MKRKNNLDRYEKQVEFDIHSYVPISGTRRRKIETILDATRKTKNINIRISQQDLDPSSTVWEPLRREICEIPRKFGGWLRSEPEM